MNVNSVSTFLATGAVLIAAGLIAVILLMVVSPTSKATRAALAKVTDAFSGYGLWLAWLMAVVATLGSLYYSQVAHFTPCEYCWYQRIGMYPMAIILGIAAFRGDSAIRRYVYPLAILGGTVSAYHYLIQNFPNLSTGVCSTTTPCTAALVWKYEFVSIPFMALVSFATILTVLLLDRGQAESATDQDAAATPEGAA